MAFIEEALEDFRSHPYEILNEAEQSFHDFYETNLETICEKLRAKLERGRREHGEVPTYTPEQLQKEFEEELLDILGYLLVDRWLNK